MFSKNFFEGKTLALASVLMILTSVASLAGNVKRPVKTAMPSVVEVHVFNENGKLSSSGSGVVVSNSGIIVTNYHVIEGATKARVVLDNGESVRVLGIRIVDRERDFAILEVEADGLHAAMLGDSSKVELGDEVVAIGAPLGIAKVISTGVVSKIWTEDGRMIQHTAPISPGNSGGPLVNELGQVIGINTFLLKDGHSLYFALPINYVKQAINRLPVKLVSLGDAKAEQEKLNEASKQKALQDFVSNHCFRYRDPDGLFEIVLPKSWRIERQVTREENGAITVTFMASDPSAEQARLTGKLSDGIRMRFTIAPDGKAWSESARKQWAIETLQSSVAGYETVKTSDPDSTAWGSLEGVEVILLGTSAKLTQPELATLSLLPTAKLLATIEVASPVKDRETFAVLLTIFKASFSLGS